MLAVSGFSFGVEVLFFLKKELRLRAEKKELRFRAV